jgi:ABC-type nitrate/sulfonate/bicarbonate transport system permease component
VQLPQTVAILFLTQLLLRVVAQEADLLATAGQVAEHILETRPSGQEHLVRAMMAALVQTSMGFTVEAVVGLVLLVEPQTEY